VRDRDGFHFVGIYVEAGDEDHVLLAIFDIDEPALVHPTHIAGAQPAAWQHHLRGFRPDDSSSRASLRAANADLTDLPDVQILSAIILDGVSVEEMGKPIDPLYSAVGGLMQAAGEVSVSPHACVRIRPVTSFHRCATVACTAMPPPREIFK